MNKKPNRFESSGFSAASRDDTKRIFNDLARKIPHNDSLAVDGRRGIFHQVPSPMKVFEVGTTFDVQDFTDKITKTLRRLRSTCPRLFIAQTFSNAYWLDLEAWDRTWPTEIHPLGFTMDTCYIVAEDFTFGIVTEPFNRRIYFFGHSLLALLQTVKELRPKFWTG